MYDAQVNEKIQIVNKKAWDQFLADVQEYKGLPENKGREAEIDLGLESFTMLKESDMRFPGV